jgi:hypothetical protein
MSREHGNHRFFPPDMSGCNQFADARDRRRRRGLAADSIATDHGFGVGNFLLGYVQDLPAGLKNES